MKQKIKPKSVPRNCHQCNREFKVRERTNFKFQRKSIQTVGVVLPTIMANTLRKNSFQWYWTPKLIESKTIITSNIWFSTPNT